MNKSRVKMIKATTITNLIKILMITERRRKQKMESNQIETNKIKRTVEKKAK